MNRTFALSGQAERSFREIARYSQERFGARRGKAYSKSLVATFQRIANGQEPHHSCRAVFAEDLREELRFACAGRHFVIFVMTAQGVLIADILHQSSNAAGRLARLT